MRGYDRMREFLVLRRRTNIAWMTTTGKIKSATTRRNPIEMQSYHFWESNIKYMYGMLLCACVWVMHALINAIITWHVIDVMC